jgi:dihydropteroate synthase
MKKLTRLLALVLALTALTALVSAEAAYTFRTSKENRVVTENGEFTRDMVAEPVLITSIGQSADVSMLDALMKKVGATYTFNATAPADEVAKYKTVIIASGASGKGLGAAGISEEDEIARAEALLKAVEENEITVILAHIGGTNRRGALSDRFSDMVLEQAKYIVVVEEGNDDGKFTDYAAENEIPITLLATIADAMTVLKDLFAPVAQ